MVMAVYLASYKAVSIEFLLSSGFGKMSQVTIIFFGVNLVLQTSAALNFTQGDSTSSDSFKFYQPGWCTSGLQLLLPDR